LEVVAMAKWIKIALWWLVDKFIEASYGLIGGFQVGGVLTITHNLPPPSSDEIERVLREQIAQRRLVDAERERFFFEGDDYESNP
jgi:hypothetical protein